MKKIIALGFAALLFLTVTFPVYAQASVININPCPEAANAGGFTNFRPLCLFTASGKGNIVGKFITLAFVVATILALIFLIIGGIKWIISGGDKAAVESARNTIVAALVGLVIVFLAYLILNFILGLFGLSLSNLQIPNFAGN